MDGLHSAALFLLLHDIFHILFVTVMAAFCKAQKWKNGGKYVYSNKTERKTSGF